MSTTQEATNSDTEPNVADPEPTGPDDTVEPPAPSAFNLPWPAALSLVVVILIAYFGALWIAWHWVTSTSQADERGDWTQLNSILGKVDYVVLFVLGAVFGISVQSGQTSAARSAAKSNKQSATRHRETSSKNEHAARRNKQTALKRGHALMDGADDVENLRDAITGVQADQNIKFSRTAGTPIHFLDGPNGSTFNLTGDESPTHYMLKASDLVVRSPELDDLADRLRTTAQALRANAR